MKRITTPLIIALLLLAPSYACAQQVFGIVATVDDTPISSIDLEGRINLFLTSANLKNTPENRRNIAPQAINSLVDETVRLEAAKDEGVVISENEIDDGISILAKQNNVSREDFVKMLQSLPGMADSLRRQIKAQLSWRNIVNKKLRSRINVSEEDIDRSLQSKIDDAGKVEYFLAEIMLRIDENETKEDVEQLAATIYDQLRQGQNFAILARQFSEGAESQNGGLIGWVKAEELPDEVQRIVEPMEVGQVTPPIETDAGIQIIALSNKRRIEAPKATGKEYKIKQIFIPFGLKKTEEAINAKFNVANSLRSKTEDCDKMDELTKVYNDPQSGDLGYIKAGSLPKEIRDIVTRITPKRASAPIERKEGYAVIMVCDVRDNGADQAQRDAIANAIGSKRLETMQQQYFLDLKNKSYIEYN